MPVKADARDYIQGMGGVDAITTHEIFMNKFAWGNLNDPKVYVDPESLNNSVRPKTNMMRAAQSLADMGKNKEAIELLDLYIEKFPDSKVPFDMYMVPFAEIYYKAGATQKANTLLKRISEIYGENLDYYQSFEPQYNKYFEEEVRTSMGILQRLGMVAKQNNQSELAAELDTLFNKRMKFFNP
jgi:tetratricopeptide (TPR) repeat protein